MNIGESFINNSGNTVRKPFAGAYIIEPPQLTAEEWERRKKESNEQMEALKKKIEHLKIMFPLWESFFFRAEMGDFDEREGS